MQTKSYDRFLQYGVPQEKREWMGLEGVLREIFPIESYDKTLALEFLTERGKLPSAGGSVPTARYE